MRKIERLLYILSLLKTNRRMRTSELASKCGVSERTIYRDIISISSANIPIYFDGGYRLLHNGFLPPANLSTHETGFIMELLNSPMFEDGKPFNRTAEGIIDKLLEADLKENIIGVVSIGLQSTDKPQDYSLIPLMEEAIRDCKVIRIKYQSLKDEVTQREIAPYGIAFRGHAWYLVGHCHLRNEIRTFRLGRVKSLVMNKEKFEKPADFSIDEYFQSSLGVFTGQIQKYRIKFTGAAAVSIQTSQHHPSEKITKLRNKDVIYEVTVSGKEDLFRWILGYGTEAELLEPVEMRLELKTTIADLNKLYEN